jgi:vacuolar protein sorting-associated protein 54
MSQVFASITHRLSEAYDPIDLHSLEAKSRLLADARYLHEKLSNLKGVRMPSNMLEVVVSEKPVFIPGAAPPSPALSPALSPPIGQGLSGLGPPGSPGRASGRQSPLHSPSLSPSPLLVRAPSFQQVPVTPPASTQSHSNIHSSAPGTTANARIKGMFARAAKFHTATAAFADLKRAPSPNPSPDSNDRSTPPLEKPLPLPLPEDANGYEQRSLMDGRTSPAPPPKRTMSGFRQVEVVDDAFANGGS